MSTSDYKSIHDLPDDREHKEYTLEAIEELLKITNDFLKAIAPHFSQKEVQENRIVKKLINAIEKRI